MTDYNLLCKQIELLLDEENKIAALCNVTACIKEQVSNLNWVGFYFLEKDELVLGPFQGKVACTHLKLNKGVCGTSFTQNKSILVYDVHEFEGHIACDSASQSELVIPISVANQLIGVLDIDAPIKNRFDRYDQKAFEKIITLLSNAYLTHKW